jgi:hypothetical protein
MSTKARPSEEDMKLMRDEVTKLTAQLGSLLARHSVMIGLPAVAECMGILCLSRPDPDRALEHGISMARGARREYAVAAEKAKKLMADMEAGISKDSSMGVTSFGWGDDDE